MRRFNEKSLRPVILGCCCLLSLVAVTQLVAYQQYKIFKQRDRNWHLNINGVTDVHMTNVYLIAGLGLLLSLVVAAYVYYRASVAEKLENMVQGKTHDLGERVKELTTIFVVNEILKDDRLKLDEVLEKIIGILPLGWQYPEICEARIVFDNKQYATKGYMEAPDKQSAAFTLQNGTTGTIEVVYTEARPHAVEGPFMQEERNLINTLADTIGAYLNKNVQQRILEESEARFRGAFENAAIGMAIVSTEGKWLQVNKGLSNIVGYSQEELEQLSFKDITHPEDLGKDLEYLREALAGNRDYFNVEKRYYHKNGSIVWINLNVALIRDAEGKPMYFVSLLENISERIESQMKFQNLVEKSLVGVYVIQGNKFVYVNPWMIEQSGYTEAELKNTSLEKFIYPEDIHIVEENIRARMSGETDEARYEVRIKDKNGAIQWIEMLGTTTMYNGTPAIIGTMVNITDKKNAYLELEKAVANLNSIFNSTAVSYLLVDEHVRIVSYNEYFGKGYPEQTGITLKEGVYYPDLMLPDKREVLLQAIATVQQTYRTVEYEALYDNKNNARWFSVSISPVLSNNNIIGYCIAGTDITNRKQMEHERQQIIYNLERRNKDLEQFSHILSHNVRAPLATLMGLTNLLQSGIDSSEQATVSAGINESARNLDNMIKDLNQILDVQRDLSEARTVINLQDVVNNIKYMLGDLIREKNAIIETDFSAAPFINCVRSFIHSILYNLILNAMKYTPDGVRPLVKVTITLPGEKLCISVADNGTGIDLEKYGKELFGLHKRFHVGIEGQGLGLFMVKTQVESINGEIEVSSEVGRGTTFCIYLQRKDVLG